jgi:hypothetical protein
MCYLYPLSGKELVDNANKNFGKNWKKFIKQSHSLQQRTGPQFASYYLCSQVKHLSLTLQLVNTPREGYTITH